MIGTGSKTKTGSLALVKMAVSILLAAGFLIQGIFYAYGAPKPEYLVSATYCSDAWVINFWNSESSRMEEELAQIRNDGFNSIILVVPWREFQPELSPAGYNPYAFEKLHQVMAAAARQDLWVVIRLGYTWDYYSEESVLNRYEALLYDQAGTRNAWLEYAAKIYDEISQYDNFYGGFITWEDFWNFTDKAGKIGHGRDSVRLAQKIGYQAYLEEHYLIEAVNQIYETELDSFDKFYLPERTEHAYQLFFRFYDYFLNDLLVQTQAVFPNLSMEVRLDVDAVAAEDGQSQIGIPHYSTYSCGEADFTAAMYGAPMGFEAGRELEAEETIEQLKQQLVLMRSYNGGKPMYLDQFLYMDETEEFAYNARLKETERAKFLELSAPVLRSMTMGYGIWTYRNYTDNAVYNAQFGLGTQGWCFEGGSEIELRKGSNMARLSAKSGLSQDLSARLKSRKKQVWVRFTADSETAADITVSIGGVSKTMQINGNRQIELNFGRIADGKLSFQSTGTVWLDDVNVYSYEQDGQLYDLDDGELSCIEAMRVLNKSMR